MVESVHLTIRPETPADGQRVRDVIVAAFGGVDEASLVDQLRGQPGVFSFVALNGADLIGFIMFSPIAGQGGPGLLRGVGLAPLAVRPDLQARGVGSALVRYGVEDCRRRQLGLVVVLGHPGYYPRHGFVTAAPAELRCKWSMDNGNFMYLELETDHRKLAGGLVSYCPEFDAF